MYKQDMMFTGGRGVAREFKFDNRMRIGLICLIGLFIGIYFTFFVTPQTDFEEKENFDVPTSTQNAVITAYSDVYDRQPNAKELMTDSQLLDSGKITLDGLKQRMIDSVEYTNLIKLQSNVVTPELNKMLSDRDMLTKIATIYYQECNKVIPDNIVLPLRDVYIYLDYNEYALRAMLRDPAYPLFEKDVQTTPSMNNPQLMDIFIKYFNKNDLVTKGSEIAKAEAAAAAEPAGVTPSCKYDRSINDSDSDSCLALTDALNNAQTVFDKNAAARALSEGNTIPDFNTNAAATDVRIPTHKGDMVLLPEMAWSVPQYRAPVCTTLGQPSLVQPVMNNSELLLGTPLDQASLHTGVGSVMPSFQHKTFVDVPI